MADGLATGDAPTNVDFAALVSSLAVAAEANGLPTSWTGIKEALRNAAERDPLDALAVTVLGGAWLFYLAEVGRNPKVTTYWDALVFVSTCLSVGYADVFARTPEGQAIATMLMTVGPALTSRALDVPKAQAGPDPVVERLDAILGELRARPA